MRLQAEIVIRVSILLIPLLLNAQSPSGACAPAGRAEDLLAVKGEAGPCGGRLVISKSAEPKTFNPLTAGDAVTRDITGLLMADLIHINRGSGQAEGALAKSWTVSPDGRKYTLHLRRGLRFSDGQLFDADDVIFTFQSYLDARIRSPQRDLLIIGGKPIQVAKLDPYSVVFTLAQPYATAERLFDGFAILPRHLLQHSYETGQLASAWALSTPPAQIAGLGPFRLKQYTPGQRVILERNPYYWKTDANRQRLPYLDEIAVIFVASRDAEALRFEAGETDVVSRLSAASFAALEKRQQGSRFRLYDLGPGFEYSFLFFNLNRPSSNNSSLREEQTWFQQIPFRKAVAAAVDRDSIVRLAFRGRAAPLSVEITPGNKIWRNRDIPPPVHSPQQARQLLQQAHFSWGSDGSLKDAGGKRIQFSVLVNAGNEQQMQMATLIQQDLKEIGIEAPPVPLDSHSLLHRIFTSHEYEAAIIAMADGDSNPNTEMNILLSRGSAHLWDLTSSYLPPWQNEIDSLMQKQLVTRNFGERKRIFDKVQDLLWQNMPAVFLASPDILVGAKNRVGNFHPALFGDYTLWNAEQLFIRKEPDAAGHS
jgi:peptide/nickel transport system substrate-binding protein